MPHAVMLSTMMPMRWWTLTAHFVHYVRLFYDETAFSGLRSHVHRIQPRSSMLHPNAFHGETNKMCQISSSKVLKFLCRMFCFNALRRCECSLCAAMGWCEPLNRNRCEYQSRRIASRRMCFFVHGAARWHPNGDPRKGHRLVEPTVHRQRLIDHNRRAAI